MTGENEQRKNEQERFEDHLSDLLTSDDESNRMFGRLLATGIPDIFNTWIHEEKNRAGFDRKKGSAALIQASLMFADKMFLIVWVNAMDRKSDVGLSEVMSLFNGNIVERAGALRDHIDAELVKDGKLPRHREPTEDELLKELSSLTGVDEIRIKSVLGDVGDIFKSIKDGDVS